LVMNRNHVALVALGVLVNTLYPATRLREGMLGAPNPGFMNLCSIPRLSLPETLRIIQPSSGRFGKPLKLAAPQCVASFRVGLHLPGRAPFFRNLLGILRCCCQAP